MGLPKGQINKGRLYEVNNGITLCHFHHPRKRKDEIKLSPYFMELIKTN